MSFNISNITKTDYSTVVLQVGHSCPTKTFIPAVCQNNESDASGGDSEQ